MRSSSRKTDAQLGSSTTTWANPLYPATYVYGYLYNNTGNGTFPREDFVPNGGVSGNYDPRNGGLLISSGIDPNLDAPISLAANPKLWLFFIAYPAKGAAEPPKMMLEFLKDGRPIRRAEAALPAPDPDGNVRYIGNFPTTNFAPGSYEVKVALAQAGQSVADRASFTLVP